MKKAQYYNPAGDGETIFTMAASNIKFGAGCLSELGRDARDLGLKRVAFFTDRNVASIEAAAVALKSLKAAGVDTTLYDQTRVEPTDTSFKEAATFAREGNFDGFVSLGGGSVIDTAKAANLYSTWPDDFLAYVNAPIGSGKAVPGALKPHIACPTTCGTGSETTGVAVFDLVEQQLKTGISSKHLKPSLAVVDPASIDDLPRGVVAATGFDVLTHAIESYTAKPYTSREKSAEPSLRPPYQGANPWSDIGSMQAISLGGRYLVRAVRDKSDTEARDALMFAATLAGLAFGNAGVHIPHAMSYSVAGLNHSYRAKGFEAAGPMVPHGISVVVNAPAAFRFTAPVAPERHLAAARALGANVSDKSDPGEALAGQLIAMMKETDIPGGIGEIGYTADDIDRLATGAFAQQRLLAQSPRPVSEADLKSIYRDALAYW